MLLRGAPRGTPEPGIAQGPGIRPFGYGPTAFRIESPFPGASKASTEKELRMLDTFVDSLGPDGGQNGAVNSHVPENFQSRIRLPARARAGESMGPAPSSSAGTPVRRPLGDFGDTRATKLAAIL